MYTRFWKYSGAGGMPLYFSYCFPEITAYSGWINDTDDVCNTFPDFTVACLLISENLAVGPEVRTQAEQSFEKLVLLFYILFSKSWEWQ